MSSINAPASRLTAKYRLRDASGWAMFVFGVLAILLGSAGILSPASLLKMLGFEVVDAAQRASHDYTLVFIVASSMASFNMGVYYVFAALTNLKAFYRWTVPFRCLTFTVFTTTVLLGYAPARFLAVGFWELAGALATGLALFFESKQAVAPAKQETYPTPNLENRRPDND